MAIVKQLDKRSGITYVYESTSSPYSQVFSSVKSILL